LSGISRELVLEIVEAWHARRDEYMAKAEGTGRRGEAIGHSAMAVTFEWAASELLANMEPDDTLPPPT